MKTRCRWLRRLEILRRKRCSINIWKGREHGWKCRREVLLIGAFLTSINLNNLSLRFIARNIYSYRSFSSDVTAAILVYQNNEMAAILVYGTGISSFLFKYFVLFHHTTGATDHVSENDLQGVSKKRQPLNIQRYSLCF